MEDVENANFQIFRDCLSTPLIEESSAQSTNKSRKARRNSRRKTAIKSIQVQAEEPHDAEELAEFIDVCPSLIYPPNSKIDQGNSISPSKSSPIFPRLCAN
jgi:hypothetical protein